MNAAALVLARRELAEATAEAEALSKPGHWTETDPAVISGIRRKPNAKADARRFAKFDREAAAWERVRVASERVAVLTRRQAIEEMNQPIPFTADELSAARYVRDRFGWHEVVRVNAKSVSVRTAWSWVDRIPLDNVLEVRTADTT